MLPAGLSSNHFHDRVEVGTTLRVGAPRGKFHLDPDSERAVVLLSGGVGLTPNDQHVQHHRPKRRPAAGVVRSRDPQRA